MNIDGRDLASFIQSTSKRLDHLEDEVRGLNKDRGRWDTNGQLHPIAINLSNIREMFLLEIIRQKGLLADLDLDPIAATVKEKLAGKSVPWGASQVSALKNIDTVTKEIAGTYED